MNKEQFWNIVDEVHSSTDTRNQKEVLAALRDRLRNLPSGEILEWKQIFSFYQDAARRNDLWAASAAMGAHCSDDGFMDFRSWLISQGRDVYMSALKDPESLVSVNTDGQELNFEDYAYVPCKAYAERRAYEEMSVGDILASYIKWAAANEQQKQNDPAAGEKVMPQKSTDFFVQSAMLGKYDLYDEMERRELLDDILRSLKEDIPQRGDIADGWQYKRTSWVLSNTLQMLKWDGRFSPANKQWAEKTFIPVDLNHNSDFVVRSHPAVLDGFVDLYRKAYQKLGLFGGEHCIGDRAEQDFTGKVLVLSLSTLKESFWSQENQLWYAHDGFGCSPHAIGRSVRCTCLGDGEMTRWDRSEFVGVLDDKYLPEWAKEKLTELTAPQQDAPELAGMTL